ncbi:MAG TPA: hydrogenase iron-sulfur subunit [Desulfobacteraceae bacterium]|nr:hydrogenase iron-sulfur subunit [Desulfobacteraceae bacterium]
MTENPAPGTPEPRIVAFCCKYCAYAAADLAGSMRLSYPADLKIIQVPCTGRIDVIHMLKALEEGADGVMLAGCLEGECHFLAGNLKAKARVGQVKKILTEIKMDPGRVEMFNLSSAMGARFAEIATEMAERIRGLGPSPVPKKPKKAAAA